MDLFRLKSLRVRDHQVFQHPTEILFSAETDTFSQGLPYFTLILGLNGTGKSNLLKLIIEIFRVAYNKKVDERTATYPGGKYSLEYFYEDGNYTILNTLGWSNSEALTFSEGESEFEKGLRFFKDGTEIPPPELRLPESIIALSILLTDKFLFTKDGGMFPPYKYFGVRRDSNTAGTKSLIARIIDCTFIAAARESFLASIKEILTFLDLEQEFLVSYSPRYKHYFFKEDLTVGAFDVLKGFDVWRQVVAFGGRSL